MQKEEITAFVVDELGKHHNRDEIIHTLCEREGMMWPETEKLVRQIAASHGQDIRARQSPLLVGLSIAIFLGGVGLIIYSIIYFASYAQGAAIHVSGKGQGINLAIQMLFIGITMITGSLFGLRRTLKELFEDKENR